MNAYANRRFAHKQSVFIKFRLQINTPKNPQLCRPLVKGGGFSQEKPEGLTLIKYSVHIRISDINKMFFNLSVSYADSSLYQREPCSVDCLCRITVTDKHTQKSAALPSNKQATCTYDGQRDFAFQRAGQGQYI